MAMMLNNFCIHDVSKIEIKRKKSEDKDITWIELRFDDNAEINLFAPIGVDIDSWVDSMRKAFGRCAIEGGNVNDNKSM